jgi:transcription-repair coupling factor (superfamily II helicase)
MGSVGYDMYCKILEESINDIKGQKSATRKQVKINIMLDAYVPKAYIKDEPSRLLAYQNISGIETCAYKDEVISALENKYGKPPQSVVNLADIALVKNLSSSLGAKEVNILNDKFEISFYEAGVITNKKFITKMDKTINDYVLNFDSWPTIIFNIDANDPRKKLNYLIDFLIQLV